MVRDSRDCGMGFEGTGFRVEGSEFRVKGSGYGRPVLDNL